jgi:predicted short-subunit dehydrogenase-like oxidoreductase (DUF2520 family)
MAKKLDIAIIGQGNWGTSLAHGCLSAGVPLKEVVVRAQTASRSGLPVVRLEDAKLDAHVLWICVRDEETGGVAEQIAAQRGSLEGQIVVHSSGALNATVLEAAKRAGAQVGSIAPVMSFPTRAPVALNGVMFAVEAEENIRATMELLVRTLGGDPFCIQPEKKPLYHAAATMASPLVLAELAAAVAAARSAGVPEKLAAKWVGTLAQTTLKNLMARGAEKSFSGPFARGDVSTIRLHLEALGEHPMLKEIYGPLARYAVEELPVQNREELRALLRKIEE